MAAPGRQRLAVEPGVKLRAREGDDGVGIEAQRRPGQGDLQRHGVGRVVQQAVGGAVGQRVHRAGRRHAHVPIAQASGPVLQAGLHAGLQHVQGAGVVGQAGEIARGLTALDEGDVGGDLAQVAEVGLEAVQPGGGQRRLQPRQGVGAVGAVHDELGQHGVVEGADLAAGLDPGFHPHVGREHHLGEQAGGGLEVLRRVFGVQAHLDAVTARRVHIAGAGRLARGLAHHPRHQVHTADLLAHAMLDLQPGVDLEEVERAGVGVEHVLHGPGVAVVHAAHEPQRGVAQGLAHRVRQMGRRGLLDHLLVAALHRAVALAEMHHMPGAVAEHLHLDVARRLHILLQVDAGFLEVGARQTLDPRVGLLQLVFAPDQLHADAAAAGRALEHHRKADAPRLGQRMAGVGQQAGSRQQRHAILPRQFARGVLEAEGAHLRRRGADEVDAGGLAGFGEIRVLRQEAVAGMDGLRAGLPGRVEDGLGLQIALRRRTRADAHGGIGHAHVSAVAVGLGIHRHGANAHALEGADDAAGDGAAIGDQDGVEHGVLRRVVPQVMGCPSRAVPAGDWRSLSSRSAGARAWGCRRCRGC
ncbi:hypothetical protein GALL_370930 [mine drainage metagenome]|uniref:Uncharacterized protein n=1 Tax=mine drainage metagenome TaxID=410659 RepID=A0A1J5QMF7_9ZZZZ